MGLGPWGVPSAVEGGEPGVLGIPGCPRGTPAPAAGPGGRLGPADNAGSFLIFLNRPGIKRQ